jgi:tRNA-binding protein
MVISNDDFLKVDIRTGKIIGVEDFPKAKKPAYKLTIDFGSELGNKRSSAQITELYTKQELLNRHIVAVINFPPKQVANFISEVLVLGVVTGKGVVLLNVDEVIPLGSRVS